MCNFKRCIRLQITYVLNSTLLGANVVQTSKVCLNVILNMVLIQSQMTLQEHWLVSSFDLLQERVQQTHTHTQRDSSFHFPFSHPISLNPS
jgi:hypothetical protein